MTPRFERSVLLAVFFVNGLGVGITACVTGEIPLVGTPLNLVWAMAVAAALLLAKSWFDSDSITKSWWLVAPAVLGIVALMWVERSELHRGVFVVGLLVAIVPLAQRIRQHRMELTCAKAFVLASLISAGMMIYFQGWYFTKYHLMRLGFLISEEGYQIVNPNDFGTQMALAALLSVWVFERTRQRRWLVLVLCFIAAVLFSGSRSAVLVVAAALGAFFLTRLASRMTWLLGIGAAVLVVIVLFDIRVAPLQFVLDRFAIEGEVATLGYRTQIIDPSLEAWSEDPRTILIGVGPGGTWKAVGARATGNPDTVYGDDGIPRLHTHNGYLEWLLSFGALGAIFGIVMLIRLGQAVWQLDRAEGERLRTGLMVFGLVFSLTGVLFVHKWWIVYGGLFLASVDREAEELAPVGESVEDAGC